MGCTHVPGSPRMRDAATDSAGHSAPYFQLWNAIPILAGLMDPFAGVLTALESALRPFRIPAGADTPTRRRRGATFVLGGIEGPSRYAIAMARGLLRSGYRGSVVLFPWNRGVPPVRYVKNLMSARCHEQMSDRLVARILDHVSHYPESPICLLAQSGGCWIVIRTLEKLPDNVTVRTAVMLSPSISPQHDLHAAAAKCRRALISVGGPGDFFYLGLGTTVFGTSDRVHSPSAGWIGWHHHPERFRELRWHPAWVRSGYLGNHVTAATVAFVERVIAPLMV